MAHASETFEITTGVAIPKIVEEPNPKGLELSEVRLKVPATLGMRLVKLAFGKLKSIISKRSELRVPERTLPAR